MEDPEVRRPSSQVIRFPNHKFIVKLPRLEPLFSFHKLSELSYTSAKTTFKTKATYLGENAAPAYIIARMKAPVMDSGNIGCRPCKQAIRP
jgi:hypothetical protein